MLSFLIARDTYHQNMWYAAIKELEECEEDIVVPTTFPRSLEKGEVSYTLFNFSEGEASRKGRWAYGPSFDGRGNFHYSPQPYAWGAKASFAASTTGLPQYRPWKMQWPTTSLESGEPKAPATARNGPRVAPRGFLYVQEDRGASIVPRLETPYYIGFT